MTNTNIPNSQLSLQGKTISMMREIVKGIFCESFISIDVDKNNRVFIVRLENNIDEKRLKYFSEKYKQCVVKVFQEIKNPEPAPPKARAK